MSNKRYGEVNPEHDPTQLQQLRAASELHGLQESSPGSPGEIVERKILATQKAVLEEAAAEEERKNKKQAKK